MSESQEEKATWRSWVATALNETNQGDLEDKNTRRLFGVAETLAAVIIMYCEPGDRRKEALEHLITAYSVASDVVDPTPRRQGP